MLAIEEAQDQYELDLNSANGTFVGEEKITHCELGHMSEFRVGSTTLMFTVTDKPDSELHKGSFPMLPDW
ncbi:MAG: FHA domain-containing protein [Acidobacteria bacterium]|nr:FHA domain-containing protein [Acidobacteriota bacterium]